MPIKQYNPTSPGRRDGSVVDYRAVITKTKPEKSLTKGKRRASGRNHHGVITAKHRGGGNKKLYRIIDFKRTKDGIPAKVEAIEYDPNRSGYVALMRYQDGERRYVLAWETAKQGDVVVAQEKAPEREGNRMRLQHITPGLTVFNVEIQPNRGGRLFRSAGAYAVLMDVQEKYAQLKMPSGEVRLIPRESYATLGKVSNADWRLVRIGSAGRARRMGKRPAVRGKAMNPVDHPHGGGEGNQPTGLKHPKTKWGKPALGVKTRRKGKYSDKLILSRRQKKKRK
jgi:large subunit ribosomal protein L2